MTALVFKNATIWFGPADLSGQANDVTMDATAPDLDATTFASGGSTEHRAGLRSAKADVKGLWARGRRGCLMTCRSVSSVSGASPSR